MKRPDVGAILGMVRLEAGDIRHGRVVQRRVRLVLAVVRTPHLRGRPADLRGAGAEAIERHQVDRDLAGFPEGARQLFVDRIGNCAAARVTDDEDLVVRTNGWRFDKTGINKSHFRKAQNSRVQDACASARHGESSHWWC